MVPGIGNDERAGGSHVGVVARLAGNQFMEVGCRF